MNIKRLTLSLATASLICAAFLLPVTPATAVANMAGEKSVAWQAEGEPAPTLQDTPELQVPPEPEAVTGPAAAPPTDPAPELSAPPAPDLPMQLAAEPPPDQAPDLPVPPAPDFTTEAAAPSSPAPSHFAPPAGPYSSPILPSPSIPSTPFETGAPQEPSDPAPSHFTPPTGPYASPSAPSHPPAPHHPPAPPPSPPPPPPPPPPPTSHHPPVRHYPYYPYNNYPYYPYGSDPYVWPYPYARWSPYVGTYSSAIVVETPQPVYNPVISTFTANPSYIQPGQSSVLTWATSNASDVTISPSVGSVPNTGVYTVIPAYTTTYTLTATGTGGSVTASTTVTVAQYYSTYTTGGGLSSTDAGNAVSTGTGGVVTSGVSAGSSPAMNLWLLYALMIGLLAVAAGVIITLLVRKPANAYAKGSAGSNSGYLASSTAPAATLPASNTPMTTPLAAGPSAKFTSEGGREISLGAGGQSIGRSDLHGFAVPGKADLLSRRHFSLGHENGDYYIEDSGSTNGTRLNGSEIRGKGKQLLKDGDKIELAGALTITFKS